MVKYADVYLRYSTHKQDEGVSIEYQMSEIEQYCAINNIVVKNWYIDKAHTAGKIAGRKQFEKYIDALYNGEANEIFIVYSTNRLFRNSAESNLISRAMKAKKIVLKSVTQNIDLDTASGLMIYDITAIFDERKITETSEQVTAAMRYMVSEKLFVGGPVPYGYKVVDFELNGKLKKKLVPNEETRHHIVKMFEMYANGFNMTQIHKWFKSVDSSINISKIRSALRRPLYKGVFIYKTKNNEPFIVENYCEPLVSEELFDAVQDRRKALEEKNDICGRKRKFNYNLTGFIKCKYCGGSCVGNSSGAKAETDKWSYYRCSYKNHPDKRCSGKGIQKYALEKRVFQEIVQNLLSENTIKELTDKVLENIKNAPTKAKDKKALLLQQNKLQKEIAELVQMKLNGDIDGETMVFMKKPKEEELSIIKNQIKEIETMIENTIDEKIIRDKVKAIFDTSKPFENCDADTLQLLFKQTVDKIILDNSQVEIHLRLNLGTVLDKRVKGLPIVTLSKTISKSDIKK